MKKFLSLFIVFNILFINSLPVFAQAKMPKPKVNVFNRAVKNGDIEQVKEYLKTGFNPNETYFGGAIICTAIDERQDKMLDFLLSNGASANPPKSQVPPLYYAIYKNNLYAVERLLQSGADLDKTVMNISVQAFGMQKAIGNKQDDLLNILLEYGANPNTEYTIPLLYYAVVKNNNYAVEKLLNAGANQDETFMSLTPEALAISKNYTEIIEIFNKHNKDKLINSTDLRSAVNLLKATPISEPFYDILTSKNATGKSFILNYAHLSKFGKEHENTLALVKVYNNQLYVYINEKLRNSSPEALATLLASVSIHQDGEDSINEEIYSALLQATLWEYFTEAKPILKQENSVLVQTLNHYKDVLQTNNYDINAFKTLIKDNPLYKGLPKTSQGFSYDELGLVKDDALFTQMKQSIKTSWNKSTTSEKLINVCAFVASFAISYYTMGLILDNTTINSTYTTIRTNSF